jgi:periplasmic protein TonB
MATSEIKRQEEIERRQFVQLWPPELERRAAILERPTLPDYPMAGKRAKSLTWIGSILLHGSLLAAGPALFKSLPEYGMDGSGGYVEVELVAAPAPQASAGTTKVAPATKPVPTPEPLMDAVRVPSRDAAPEPTPQPIAESAPLLTATSGRFGDGSSPIAGQDATTQQGGNGNASAKPSYYLNPPPAYPKQARQLKQQGRVLVEVHVTRQGRAAQCRIKESSGFPLLDQAALDAVQNWRFRPARLAGVSVDTVIDVPIRFELT